MQIEGLQKLTLLDFPGRVACTVFLDGCNYRCPFCHNSELLEGTAPALMDDRELLAFLEKRKGLLEGVCFTGGEPLLRRELPELLRQVKALGYPVKLDTNGTFPDRLKAAVAEGLVDYVAMDVKNSPARYAETAGVADALLPKIGESIAFLLSGAVDYEFRTTVTAQLHAEEDIRAIGAWVAGAKRFYLQPFTDRDTVPVAGLSAPDEDTLRCWAEILRETVGLVEVRG